jgi:hypothetical protein
MELIHTLKVYLWRLITINEQYIKGRKDCLEQIINTINFLIENNNGARTTIETIAVFNTIIQYIEIQKLVCNDLLTELQEENTMDKEGRRE